MSDLRQWFRTPSTSRDCTVLVVALVVCFAVMAGHLPFGSSVRYAEAAREMVELNDWVVPHLHYVPYCEKPILSYWLAAGSRWLLGPSLYATHLPSALMGLVSVLCTWALAKRLHGGGFPLAAALMLLGSGMFLVMTSELTTDPILSGVMAVAWLAGWRTLALPIVTWRSPWLWTFWTALGFGVLTKGPVAVVLAAVAIGGFAFLDGGWRGLLRTAWRLRPDLGLLIIVAINAPWSWAMWQRDPRFLDYFYIRFNLQAFYSDQVNHTGPMLMYVGVLAAAFFPWSLQTMIACGERLRTVGWPALRSRWRDLIGPETASKSRSEADRLRLYLLCVLIFPLLFLTISASKLGTYLMPMYPAIALLVCDALWMTATRPPAWQRWAPLITTVALTIAALITWPILHWTQPDEAARLDWSWWPLLTLVGIALLGGHAWAAWSAWRGRVLHGIACAGVGTAIAIALLAPFVHLLIRDLGPYRLTELVNRLGSRTDPVVVDRDLVHDYNLVYGLGRRVVIHGNARECGMGFFAQIPARGQQPFPSDTYLINGENLPEHPWLCSWNRLLFALRSTTRVWVFAEDDLVERLRAAGAPITVVDRAANVVLVTNHPGERSAFGVRRSALGPAIPNVGPRSAAKPRSAP